MCSKMDQLELKHSTMCLNFTGWWYTRNTIALISGLQYVNCMKRKRGQGIDKPVSKDLSKSEKG